MGPRLGVRRALRVGFSLALGGALLWLAFRGAELEQLRASLAGVRVAPLVAAIAVDLVVFLAKALKWRLLLQPLRRLPVLTLYSGIAVGALVANVVPLRLDELARSLYLARRSGLTASTVLGTIVLERMIDVAILLCVIGVLLLGFQGEPWLLRAGVVLAAVLTAFTVARLALARRQNGVADNAAAGSRGRATQMLERLLDGLGQGLAVMPRGARLVRAFGLGVAEWALALVHLTLVLAAFGVVLAPGRALLLAAASYLGFALPTGPAGIGGFELLVKAALEAGLALPPARALGIALAIHALLVIPISLVGVMALAREGGARTLLDPSPGAAADAEPLTTRAERA